MLTGCCLWLAQLLLYTLQDHLSRAGTSHKGCFLPHQSSVRRMYHRLAHKSIINQENVLQVGQRPIWWENFLLCTSIFQNDFSLCQVDIKTKIASIPT